MTLKEVIATLVACRNNPDRLPTSLQYRNIIQYICLRKEIWYSEDVDKIRREVGTMNGADILAYFEQIDPFTTQIIKENGLHPSRTHAST